jgi:hypothetical protein
MHWRPRRLQFAQSGNSPEQRPFVHDTRCKRERLAVVLELFENPRQWMHREQYQDPCTVGTSSQTSDARSCDRRYVCRRNGPVT